MKNGVIAVLVVALLGLSWWHFGEVTEAPEVAADRFGAVREVVRSMQGAEGFREASVGFCLLDSGGAVVVDERGGEAMIPASALKTVATATALELLGPGFRFETRVGVTAEVVDGVVDGDLVVVGGGDPTLGEVGLGELVEAVRGAGVLRVTGGVIGDARVFPEAGASDYWNWGDVGNAYGAPVCGLNFARNRLVLGFRPGRVAGERAEFLGASLQLDGVEWENRVVTGAVGSGDGTVVYGGPYAGRVVMRGTVPAGEKRFEVGAALPDPPRYVAQRVRQLLEEGGVRIDGAARGSREVVDAVDVVAVLGRTRSVPLEEIVRHINRVSDNVEAQVLYLKTGGEQAVREHWAGRGLVFSGLRIEDGSGLARANHVTPLDLARLNRLAATGPAGDVFVGVSNPYYGGRVRWKGGAMSSVRSYVGCVDSESGERFTFCLMVNHYRSSAEVFGGWRAAVVESVLRL